MTTAESRDLYILEATVKVPVKVVGTCGGYPVGCPEFPFQQMFSKEIDMVVARDYYKEASNGNEMFQISDNHMRSSVYPEIYRWTDQYGNRYRKLGLKGNRLDFPVIRVDSNFDLGYSTQGLFDSGPLRHLAKASQYIRSIGMDTEAIAMVVKPMLFPAYDQTFDEKAFKQLLLNDILAMTEEERLMDEKELRGAKIPTKDEIFGVQNYLDNTDYCVLIRAVQVNERLSDLKRCKTKEDLYLLLQDTFDYINEEENEKATSDKGYTPLQFDFSDESIAFFFSNYLPKRVASNFKKMHANGCFHKYAHTGNISVLGAVLDVDSICGKEIDGTIATKGNFYNDVFTFLERENGYTDKDKEIAYTDGFSGILSILDELQIKKLVQSEGSISNLFKEEFLKIYDLDWLIDKSDSSLFLPQRLLSIAEDISQAPEYLDAVFKQEGIIHSFGIEEDAILKKFFVNEEEYIRELLHAIQTEGEEKEQAIQAITNNAVSQVFLEEIAHIKDVDEQERNRILELYRENFQINLEWRYGKLINNIVLGRLKDYDWILENFGLKYSTSHKESLQILIVMAEVQRAFSFLLSNECKETIEAEKERVTKLILDALNN